MRKIILFLLLCTGIVSCASQQQPDPYEQAGYVRYGYGRPSVVYIPPDDPFRELPRLNEFQQRLLQQRWHNQ